MPPNTSGSIRQALGRARSNAVKHTDRCKELFTAHPPPWNNDISLDMTGILDLMEKDVKNLDELWEKWEKFTDRIQNDDDHEKEEKLFNEWRDNDLYMDAMDLLVEYIAKATKAIEISDAYIDRVLSATTQKEESNLGDDLRETAKKNAVLDKKLGLDADSEDDTVSHVSLFTLTRQSKVPIVKKKKKPPEPESCIITPIPQLNIPKFNGEYIKWNAFWQIYDIAIHKQNYPKVSKLISLRSFLGGRALEEVESFSITGENYDTVVKKLKDRFGNPQFLIREFDLKMNALRPASSNAASIRSTVVAITNICREMENFGINTDNYSLKNQIINKLPPIEKAELQLLLFEEPETSTDCILEKMKKMEIKAELFASAASTTNSYAKPTSSDRSWRNQPPQFSNKPPQSQYQPPVSYPTTCTFCDGDHATVTCRKYSTVEDRLQRLHATKRCMKCMGKNHLARNCPKTDLKCIHCQQPHYAFLCEKGGNQRSSKAMLSINRKQSTLLSKKINVMNPDRNANVQATVFFDSGAQRSYVTNKLVKALQLPIVNTERLNVEGFGGRISTHDSDLVKFNIKTNAGTEEIFANSIYSIADRIPVVEKKGKEFAKSNEIPDILIGMDYFCKFIINFKEVDRGYYEVNSKFGKMFCGEIPIKELNTISSHAITHPLYSNEDEQKAETFWKLESMGINESPTVTNEDEIAQQQMEASIKFKDKRYYISWPFKPVTKPLPSNAGLSIGRLRSNLKKLQQQPNLFNQYQAILDDQVDRKTLEIAPAKPQGSVVYYLPHHAVITPQKTTTKIRMVFDGSAKSSTDAPSLNECIYRGPIDMPEIPGLLMRLRTSKILITGDIEKAFHQIYLNEPDRDAVRFFWVKDPSKDPSGDNLITYRFVGVPFGVISSPSMLSTIIKYHLEKKNIAELLELLEILFVDNIHALKDDPTDAIRIFHLIRATFLEASMNVREWMSNDPTVLAAIPTDLQQNSTNSKVLGIGWDAIKDTFSIELKAVTLKEPWTKRKVLKFIASTYDPLGLLSPVTVKARIFMQKLFKEDLKWDDPISPKLVNEWKFILDVWDGTIEIPRRFVQCKYPNSDNIEIHVFADASQFAYCAAVYLRIKTPAGYQTPIVFAKTKLQPYNKNLTIPKMEVMGIWLAAKIGNYVAKELHLDHSKKFIWTDSQIAFYWFRKWPKDIFVSNRLKEVLNSKADCLFVPGHLNPADLGTRGVTFNELQKSLKWWTGPEFLKESREKWPPIPELARYGTYRNL